MCHRNLIQKMLSRFYGIHHALSVREITDKGLWVRCVRSANETKREWRRFDEALQMGDSIGAFDLLRREQR